MKNEIINKKTLVRDLESGCKEFKLWRIGTEHEKFAYFNKSLKPIKYKDIQIIFNSLHKKFGWQRIFEDNKVISLKKSGSSITLEPGGQIELSGEPKKNLFQTCLEVNSHQHELNSVSNNLDINYMGMGFIPKWEIADIEMMPKARYKIMSEYMKKVGSKGLDMMFRTATIQANLDFDSEKDMIKKFRVALSIQPAIIALYANSPFVSGKLTDFLSYRSWVWRNTDEDRCGILPLVFDEGFSFESYVDYLLDVPMYFIRREGKYIDCSGLSFKKFLAGNIKKLSSETTTMDDWNDHLTVVFPEVRLKKYLELRGADGGPWSSVCALPAFWTGIFYNSESLDETWDIVKKWNNNDREKFYFDVSKYGLTSKTPDNYDVKLFLKKILNLSIKGLKKRKILNENRQDEAIFLDPLLKILERGESPAEIWKRLYLNNWNENIDNIYKINSFSNLEELE